MQQDIFAYCCNASCGFTETKYSEFKEKKKTLNEDVKKVFKSQKLF